MTCPPLTIRPYRTYKEEYPVLKDIACSCGSPVVKDHLSYLSFMEYTCKKNGNEDKFYGDIFNGGAAFWFAIKNKKNIRLIDVAVKKEYQGKGLATAIVAYEVKKAKSLGYREITFRTPMDETAYLFWERMGAVRTGKKGNDWTMVLKF